MQRVSLPREGLYPIRVLAVGAAVYGVAAALHGSGFLAVFIVGLLIGDVHAPYKTEIDRFHTALASLAEIAVFVALGLTIFGPSGLWDDLPEGHRALPRSSRSSRGRSPSRCCCGASACEPRRSCSSPGAG